jgi:hypothetical protein
MSSTVKSQRIVVRLNKSEKTRIEAAAVTCGLPVAAWLRMVGLKAASKTAAKESAA